MENFSGGDQSQDSLQDMARSAGTKEDALHPAVFLTKTETRSSHELHVACIEDCVQAQRRRI